MDAYELEMSASDIGEIVEIIRIQHLKMNDEAFCHALDLSPKILAQVEDGKGAHGINVLKKINKKFPNVGVKLLVELS